jgi:hypothetical protein
MVPLAFEKEKMIKMCLSPGLDFPVIRDDLPFFPRSPVRFPQKQTVQSDTNFLGAFNPFLLRLLEFPSE